MGEKTNAPCNAFLLTTTVSSASDIVSSQSWLFFPKQALTIRFLDHLHRRTTCRARCSSYLVECGEQHLDSAALECSAP